MTAPAPRPDDLAAFDAIPDPAAPVAARPPPAAPAAPREPSPTRAERRVRALAALALALAWIGALAWVMGLRPDLGAPFVAAQIGIWSLAAVVALVVALRRGARGLPASVRFAQAVVAAVPLVFLATALRGEGPAAGGTDWATLRGCSTLAILFAVVPLALAAFVLRRSFASAPGWRGAAFGAVCGLGGAIGVHAHCPAAADAHVVVAHGLPIAVGVIAGALLGAWRGRA